MTDFSTFRFQFAWSVSEQGYRWVETRAAGKPKRPRQTLASRAPDSANTHEPARRKPDYHLVLFRLFAELGVNERKMLEFADRYGNLNDRTPLPPQDGQEPPPVGGEHGVSLEYWSEQVGAMVLATWLWDQIQAKNETRLRQHITWQQTSTDERRITFFSGAEGSAPIYFGKRIPYGEVIASSSTDPNWISSVEPGDVLIPARRYLQKKIDQQLNNFARQAHVFMTWDVRQKRPVVGYVCPTVLAAVWLQLATVVNETLDYGRCRECGTWFEIAPEVARASRRFCSASCRTKAYRQRQDRARQLFMAKKTFEQIADDLDSDVATVKRWITGSKDEK